MDSPYYQNIPDDDLQNSCPDVSLASQDLQNSDDRHLLAQKLSPFTPQYSPDPQSTVTQSSVSFYKSMHEPFADLRSQEMRPLKHTLTLEECIATLPGYDSSQTDNYATMSHNLKLDTDPHSHQSTWAPSHRSKLTEETPQTHNHLLLASQTINPQIDQLGKKTFTSKEYTAHLHCVQTAVNSNNIPFEKPRNKDFITDGDGNAVSGDSFGMAAGECTPPYCEKYHTVKTHNTGPAAQETKVADPGLTETLLMSDDVQLSATRETKLTEPNLSETVLLSDIQISAAQETILADPVLAERIVMSDIQLSAAREKILADPALTETLLMSDIKLSAGQEKLSSGRYTTAAIRETPPLMPDAEQKITTVTNNEADSAVRETLVSLRATEDESPSAVAGPHGLASFGITALVGSTCDGLRADGSHDDGEKVSHNTASDDVGDKTKTTLLLDRLLPSVKDQHNKTEAATEAEIIEAKPPAVLPQAEGMKKILEQAGEEIISEPKAKRMKISESEGQRNVIAQDNIVVTSPDDEATTPRKRFVAATFVNVKEAIESVPLRETDVLDDSVEDQDQQRSSPPKKRVAAVSKRNSAAKRARVSESSSKSATHRRNSYQDDTEPEAPSLAKLKKRKTVSGSPVSATDCLMTLSLTDLPPGWAEPLLYFSKEKEYVKAWKSLPSRKVSTGAVYLDSECTGVPGVKDHVSGPTCILRDLCALLKAPSENLMLHERNYVSLSRANARETIKPIKANGSFSMGMTYVFRAQSERDSIQPIPMDMISFSLVKQLKAMSKHTNLFPSHIFAMEIHTWQYAPTIALHLQAVNWPKKLKSLLEMFCSPTDCDYLKTLETSYHHKLLSSRGMSGRRRGDKALSTFQTFEMGAEEKRLVNRVCDGVAKNLQNLRNTRIPLLKAESVSSESSYKEGDLILQDIEVDLLTRSSAALRFRVYEYYGIPDRMVELTTEMVADDPTETTYFENLKKHLQREDERWLDTLDQANYLDFSLTKSQHEWLMSERRLKGEEPPQDIKMTKEFVVLQNILVSSETSKPPNVTIVVKMANSKFFDTCSVHKLNLSLMATRDITQGEEIQLQPNFPHVTWHDLANDDSSTEEISS